MGAGGVYVFRIPQVDRAFRAAHPAVHPFCYGAFLVVFYNRFSAVNAVFYRVFLGSFAHVFGAVVFFVNRVRFAAFGADGGNTVRAFGGLIFLRRAKRNVAGGRAVLSFRKDFFSAAAADG